MSPIRASLCNLRLSARISKLSIVVNAALIPVVSRDEKFFEQSRICDVRIISNSAGGSHLICRAAYQIVALKLDFPLRRSVYIA